MEEKISRGARKVEEIARGGRNADAELQAAAANGGTDASQKSEEKELAERIVLENERAAHRIERAQAEKRKEKERAALKRERREEARQHRREVRAARRKQNDGKTPGFGGWLAAVVSLSVAVLALGAIVTVGYFDLSDTRSMAETSYRTSVYEFSELVERLDTDLAKARVAEGREMQRLLTEVLVESELAQVCVEQFPVEAHSAERVSSFFSRAERYSRALLYKLSAGKPLTEGERAAVEYLYASTEKMREGLPELVECAQNGVLDKILMADGDFCKKFDALAASLPEAPEEVVKAFTLPEPHGLLEKEQPVSEEEALRRAGEYFRGLSPENMRVTGKTEREGAALFNVEFQNAQGESYFAQITERGGKLAFFDGYKACERHNFDMRAAVRIAESFLQNCGYADMRPVWVSESGSECRVEFVSSQDGVLTYSDRIFVKVCTERGKATGLDAHLYLKNHGERTLGKPSVSREKVAANARKKMQLFGVRAALIPVYGQEVLCWEICGEYGGRQYFVYVDATTGETVWIRTVSVTDRGMLVA